MKGPFKVIEFDDSPDENIVFLEGPREDFISDDPKEAQSYLDDLRAHHGSWRSRHRILLTSCARLQTR